MFMEIRIKLVFNLAMPEKFSTLFQIRFQDNNQINIKNPNGFCDF